MSSHEQNKRREFNGRRSRFSGNSSHCEWIPRGSNSNSTTIATTTASIPPVAIATSDVVSNSSPVSNFNLDVNNKEAYSRSRRQTAHNRMNMSSRLHTGNSSNQRRYREREAHQESVKHENLPQLVQEIQEKLMKGNVECMICYDMVKRSAPIWSCSSCYSIFHLSCIKKWARAPTSVDLSAEKSQGSNWRCPGCQSVQLMSVKDIHYICFCGRRQDPPSDLYLTPHSCGEPCGKTLEREFPASGMSKDDMCPHVCVLQCHPGPCPPCKAFAPPRLCPCGKETITTRCSERRFVLTCGQQCNKLLDCGRHRCEKVCHVDSCYACQVLVNAWCFCKKKTEVVLCGEMIVKGEVKAEDGVFSCNSSCGKMLGCGNHVCRDICHPGPCGECNMLPTRIKTCCCGKTSLGEQRKSCLDPIPTCSQICGKKLPCGVHFCNELCHTGECPPCLVPVTQNCRCRSTSQKVECYKTTEGSEKFTCDRPCGQKKSCGRHRCSERCCPRSNSGNVVSGDWDPHLCSVSCGKKLRCGKHSCESLCHSGHCPPCLETIFTDLTCACGRTSIPPPLPCGTPPPSCQLPCSVPQSCGHLSSHSCHFGECPPCSIPIAKECVGGHVVLSNIPCGSKDIRCNKLCGKTRQCGLHACARICHPPPCDPSCEFTSGGRASCGQTCGAPRRDCRHTCTSLCHPSTSCPDTRCEFPVTITCSCGRLTASVPCDAGGNSTGHSVDSIFEASIIQKLPVPLQPIEVIGKKIPLGQRKLACDDECAKVERKKRLADAFDISPNLDALHFGENAIVSEVLSDFLRRDSKWVLSVEERCKFLVLGRGRSGMSTLKVHVFCPMLKEKRDAVRLIAERWKLSVSAAGWEPKRFIVVHVTPKSKAPSRILGAKVLTPANMIQPSVFDPLVDMDPRLVVALFDLPRDADVSALVLRFGGECELVWLNDKNALAVFNDPARAATAMRRLDQGSVYHGAAVVLPSGGSFMNMSGNVWGGAGVNKDGGAPTVLKSNLWKKMVEHDQDSRGGSSWGSEESRNLSNAQPSTGWKGKEAPISANANRWSILVSESTSSSSVASLPANNPVKRTGSNAILGLEAGGSSSSSTKRQQEERENENDVVDDWEQVCD